MNLQILVLYTQKNNKIRKTIDDHLYSFRRYSKGIKYLYFNALYGIPRSILLLKFDAVIIHYTVLAQRYAPNEYHKFIQSLQTLKEIKATKLIIPQDEYNHTDDIVNFIKDFKIDIVLSCADKKTFKILYPDSQVKIKSYYQVLPGYVDELTKKDVNTWLIPNKNRSIDIGYRGRKLPLWTGAYNQKKFEIGDVIKKYCRKNTNLKIDISSQEKDTYYGKSWLQFLGKCKAVLGCESGATLMDRDGSVRQRVEKYTKKYPQSTFRRVEKICFPNLEGNISLLTISPRHFEAAMTQTCQILLEGEYAGILKPNVHYIPLKSDYSNLPEVIEKFRDKKYRNSLIKNAYRDLILSKKYSYKKFVTSTVKHIEKISKHKNKLVNCTLPVSDKKSYKNSFLVNIFSLPIMFWNVILSLNAFYHLKRGWNKFSFYLIILPGSTIKQSLVRNNLWPFKISKEYLKRIEKIADKRKNQ